MRVDELIVASSGQVLRIGFHDRMTVLSGFDPAEREGLTETLQTRRGRGRPRRRAHVLRCPRSPRRHHPRPRWTARPSRRLQPVELGAASAGREPAASTRDDPSRRPRPRPEGEPRRRDARAHRSPRAPRNARGGAHDRPPGREEGRGRGDRARRGRWSPSVRGAGRSPSPLGAGRRPGSRRCAPRPTCFVAAASARRPIDGSSAARRSCTRSRTCGSRCARSTTSGSPRSATVPRLDAETVRWARTVPEEAPGDLHRLVQQVDEAEQERDELSARLFEASASKLPEPSTPAVVDLARGAADALAHAPRGPRRPHPPRRRAALARRHGQLDRGRVDRAADRRVADPGRASRTPQPPPLPRRHRHCRHCRHR